MISLDAEAVVELDSSTATKFSRHLIIPLKGAAFANNGHVGAFVGAMLAASHGSEQARRLHLNKVDS